MKKIFYTFSCAIIFFSGISLSMNDNSKKYEAFFMRKSTIGADIVTKIKVIFEVDTETLYLKQYIDDRDVGYASSIRTGDEAKRLFEKFKLERIEEGLK